MARNFLPTELHTVEKHNYEGVQLKTVSGTLVGEYGYHPIQLEQLELDSTTNPSELLEALQMNTPRHAWEAPYDCMAEEGTNGVSRDMSNMELVNATPDEIKVIKEYTSDLYIKLNHAHDKLSENDEEKASLLNNAIGRLSTNMYRRVFRGANYTHPMFDDYQGNVAQWVQDTVTAGGTYRHAGFMSTTLSLNMAKGYAGVGISSGDSLVFDILTPSGIALEGVTVYDGEHEVVLPNNTSFTVLHVERVKDAGRPGRTLYIVRMIETL